MAPDQTGGLGACHAARRLRGARGGVRGVQLQGWVRSQERQAARRGVDAVVHQHQHARNMPVPQRFPAREGHGVEGDAAQARRVHRGSLLLQQAPRGDPGGHDLPRGLRRHGRTDGGFEKGRTRVVPRHAGAANGGEFDAGHERGRVEPQRGDGARDRAVRHGPLHHARRRDRRVRRGPRRPRAARQRVADQVGFSRVPLLGV